MKKKITIIHSWSTPRSRSTAVLYSFESRKNDTVALDEPLYYEWLKANPKAQRPYLNEVSNWVEDSKPLSQRIKESIELLLSKNLQEPGIIYIKHISKFESLFDFSSNLEVGSAGVVFDDNVEIEHKYMFLIRDPFHVLSSWDMSSNVHGGAVEQSEVGFMPIMTVYSKLQTLEKSFCILDSDELGIDAEVALTKLCNDLNISFQDSMLSWEAGPHACDGAWASHWYSSVHSSTGFTSSFSNNYKSLPPNLYPCYKVSVPIYQILRSHAKPSFTYPDERNERLLVYVGKPNSNGMLVPRDLASVSPWDSSVQGGDACWEGLRVYNDGKILSLERHLTRLLHSAKALFFQNIHSREEIKDKIFATLAANHMRDGAHIRLTLTRGEKFTSSMNPKFNVFGTTLIVLAEWKAVEGITTYDNSKGISLITSSVRRNPPSTGVDSKIHHNNMINNILPKIQANICGVEDALMLDVDGYVSETNATNIFLVDHNSTLITSHADHCLPGITRETILILGKELGIDVEVRRVSLAEFYVAHEVFTTGTMGELTPVTCIDGRVIHDGKRGEITLKLQNAYKDLLHREEWYTQMPSF